MWSLLLHCLSMLSLWSVLSAIVVPFNCGSRAADKPFSKHGVPVQFIHIPKDGGQSVQHWLNIVAGKANLDTKKLCRTDDPSNYVGTNDGTILMGHCHIGYPNYSMMVFLRTMFISVTRDPIELAHSLFFYKASLAHTEKNLEHLPDAGRKQAIRYGHAYDVARSEGINTADIFWHLVLYDDEFFARILTVVGFNLWFFIPDFIEDANLNITDSARCSIQFALHQVSALDDLTHMSGFLDQLAYHAPKVMTPTILSKLEHVNAATIKPTAAEIATRNVTLEQEARAKFMSVPKMQGIYDVYDVLRIIGAARREQAERSLATKHKPKTCVRCSIEIPARLEWLFESVPNSCSHILRAEDASCLKKTGKK